MNVLDFGFGSLEAQLWQIFFLSIRCGAALMAAPMVGGTAVPAPLRILLSLTLGFFIATWVPLSAPPPEMLSIAAILAILPEIAVGLMLGFVLQLAFAIPLIAAEQISGTMGLAIATSIDPASGAQSGALGTFFGLVLSLLFYATGAHLLWFELLIESYRLLPAGQFAFGAWRAEAVVMFMGYGLAAAAAIALPVVLVLLLVQIVTGLIARSAPSLNLFALGLPAGVLAGIAALIIAMPVMVGQLRGVIESALEQSSALIEAR
ncbi:flagellar biosynthetic protein FliR [Erythrobacter sp. BLCC-B19]|uniref:flagellar biosynthetic protein FliR n=1 Tax=Erythrobacter sp. BLCC-B19 TaxID=3025315 RepID=UPI002361C856|nr:flagellar biosynthetic protein FliR [Erythrobacter sp. BLCC-B19]WDA41962.1 flagellar biosynthetic protein FliR [Erythrobacter sp. BLCC-B19]